MPSPHLDQTTLRRVLDLVARFTLPCPQMAPAEANGTGVIAAEGPHERGDRARSRNETARANPGFPDRISRGSDIPEPIRSAMSPFCDNTFAAR
jgi:hypothetical protein